MKKLTIIWGLACYAFAAQAQQEVKVKYAGELKKIHRNGDLSAHVSLDTLASLPHMVGLGPLEGLKGEITLIDSKAYVTRTKGLGATTNEDPEAKAAFLVYAQVPEWNEFPIPTAVKDMIDLQEFILYIAKTERFVPGEAFPFLIKGPVASAKLHVVNKTGDQRLSTSELEKSKALFEVSNRAVEMVGFYSTKHQGIFTHHGNFTHIHLITQDKQLSGHLDDVRLQPGKCTLLLPDLPETQRKKPFKLILK